ncbi:hypothetical protein N7539_003206 [Penicillium diatomitis]|uniref:Serine-rich protein n=1 Tax=Penicillium diatomitis TaxID=2819901 RepID=A0A9X0BZL1_9EURO|nr:uncharacterized protein N7539_003206 [Penicillium diatomitis]KAJ5491639.1 hypothetical protein N7539_003206 [Penicillium diatomitis]
MSTSRPSTSPGPRPRRVLQERSSAHTNERSPTRSMQSLRIISGDKDDADMYTATPFPTKPEQILLPIPGKGQRGPLTPTGLYASNPRASTSTISSPSFSQDAASSTRDLSIRDSWDVSSMVDTFNSPPGLWDDPSSSKSSLPDTSPMAKLADYISEGPWEPEYSDDDENMDLPTRTPTIKAIESEYQSSSRLESDDDGSVQPYSSPNVERIGAPSSPNYERLGEPSSPNLETIGAPSSPNFERIGEPSSPNLEPIGEPSSPNFRRLGEPSSPNMEPIGAPSSPNFVTLANTSETYLPPAAARSNSNPRSSSLSSWNSRGTAVRHTGVSAPWIQTAASSERVSTRSGSPFNSSPPLQSVASFQSVTRRISAEQMSTRSGSLFRSSPPLRSVASFQSVTRRPSLSQSRSPNSSTLSFRSVSEIVASIDSGIPLQHAAFRSPSTSSQAAVSVVSDQDYTRFRDFTPGPASGRQNPVLSRSSSTWSSDAEANIAVTRSTGEPASRVASNALTVASKFSSHSSEWQMTESDEEERLDSLTNLPSRPDFAHSVSTASRRSNSMTSMKRPSTGASSNTVWHILPTWAKIYYRADPMSIHPALSVVDVSRPPSTRPGTSNSSVFNFGLMPTALNIPRGRSPSRSRSPSSSRSPQRITAASPAQSLISDNAPTQIALPQRPGAIRFVPRRVESDPLDPRAHWVANPDVQDEVVGTPHSGARHSWSPHLLAKRGMPRSTSAWTAPSMDSRNEPVFGRRNIQVYSFCVGFIFPIAWMIAAFLPLPPLPKLAPEMTEHGGDVEAALESQLISLQRRRHENARWWRNLNRWMISLGAVIIIVIIVLAVIGTTTGF